jgi:AcrR family transcriptional regulator
MSILESMLYNYPVPRPPLHTSDSILDATRDLVASQGPRSVRIDAVAAASKAPVGSIYHRFGSLDELLARTWLRAARRSQEALLEIEYSEPGRGLLDAALATYDFCLAQPAEALTLNAIGVAELRDAELARELAIEIVAVNAPLEETLAKLAIAFGGDVEPVLLAAIDLPYGVARRYLKEPRRAPQKNRERLAEAVCGMLGDEAGVGLPVGSTRQREATGL